MQITLEALQHKKVHLLGIGGIGVSGVARLLKARGIDVSGCDVRESSILDDLRREGIPVTIGHRQEHVDQNDLLVYSTAVPGQNPELSYARHVGRPLLHRSHLLGAITAAHTVSVGVTGTNGKGTVCAMLTHVLREAGRNPSFFVGALCPNLGTNALHGSGDLFVAELDESDGSLVNVVPTLALVNNLELDHLNYYKDFNQTLDTIQQFIDQLPADAVVFLNGDDAGTLQLASRIPGRRRVLFGTSPECDVRYEAHQVADDRSSFTVYRKAAGGEQQLGRFHLNVPGEYNIENAAGVIAVALQLGVAPEAISNALASFAGLQNRYTLIESQGRKLVKDYMSHPAGIRKVLVTARLGTPGKLYAVFKPYRYTMIHYHAQNYADAFALADEVIVTRMWDAGEDPIPGVDTPWLADQIARAGVKVTYLDRMDPIVDHLEMVQRPGDCAVFFGGNDLFELVDQLALRFQSPPT